MIYGSVCSGIEAASVAWSPLGMRAAFFSEIDSFPRAVLRHHYPEVPLHGDFTTIKAGEYQPIDLLVGGTPCQSFSVAGLRGGLADERGNLALECLRLAQRLCARWIVWENVPGIRSSGDGRDFGSFLGGLGELGYGWAYRSLDAQYFGLAQRRERVFVVGYLGDWRRAAAVLFEPESLRGHPSPRRKTGEGVANAIRASASPNGHGNSSGLRGDGSDNLIAQTAAFGGGDGRGPIEVAATVNAAGRSHGRLDFESEAFIAHALRADGFDASEDGTGRGTPLVPIAYRTSANNGAWDTGDRIDALTSGTDRTSHILSVALRGREGGATAEVGDDVAFAIRASKGGGDKPHVLASAVRRLTPLEYCRLQGFPDDYLDITYRKRPASDGPKYKALGNSMAVPVMRSIGQRILQVEGQNNQ